MTIGFFESLVLIQYILFKFILLRYATRKPGKFILLRYATRKPGTLVPRGRYKVHLSFEIYGLNR